MEIDGPSMQPRTRPDLCNLIHPQSNIELLTSEDMFDMVMVMAEEEVASNVMDNVDAEKVELPAASSSKSDGTLNPAWGSFMLRAAAGVSKTKSTKSEKKRGPSPSSDEQTKKAKYESISGPTGLSSSAQAEKRYAADLDSGKSDPKKMAAFKKACLEADTHAEFSVERLRAVRCSRCGKETVCTAQKGAPNPHRFTEHRRRCVDGVIRMPKTQVAAENTSTLTSGAFKGFQKLSKLSAKISHVLIKSIGSSSSDAPPAIPMLPCPGITEADHPKVNVYLCRSSALGGGSRSIHRIAKEVFDSSFIKLTEAQKNQVYDQQDSEHTWRNNHRRMNCRSTSCRHLSVEVTPTGRILPCSECRKVLALRAFHNALNHLPTDPKNHTRVNKRFRNELLAHQWASTKGFKDLVESVVRSYAFVLFLTQLFLE